MNLEISVSFGSALTQKPAAVTAETRAEALGSGGLSRSLGLDSQHIHGAASQLPATPASGDPVPPSGLFGHQTYMQGRHTCNPQPPTYLTLCVWAPVSGQPWRYDDSAVQSVFPFYLPVGFRHQTQGTGLVQRCLPVIEPLSHPVVSLNNTHTFTHSK